MMRGAVLCGVLVMVGGCAVDRPDAEPTGAATASPEPVANVAAPAPGSAVPRELPGLHNVIVFGDGVISGSMPHGDAGLDSLRALGVRSVLSVDGARPAVEDAEARGMVYAHVPIEYSGINGGETDAIAAAIWDLPRPIYVHCHHGKHRGPAAAAAGLIATGEIDTTAGLGLLEVAGTSEAYTGLWKAVRTAEVFDEQRWERVPRELPSAVEPTGMLDAMVEINTRWDHLQLLAGTGWIVPADHPDLVPAAEAGIMADHFRTSLDYPEVTDGPEEMAVWMAAAASLAVELEDALAAGDRTRATEVYTKIGTSCKSCHRVYRD